MIYDALLTLDLPSEPGPPLPTRPLQGMENLLFTGRWASRRASCPLSGAAVLARCMGVLMDAGGRGLRVVDDAGTILDQRSWAEPGDPKQRWPEALPPRWTEQPCELEMRALVQERGIAAAVTLRYTPRHDPEQGALTGSLRALWDIAPREGAEQAFQRSFEATFAGHDALSELARRLRDRGEQLSHRLTDALQQAFDLPPESTWGRVVALHGYRERPERFADLLAGLPEARRLQLALFERALARSHRRWPALDAEGIPGHLHRGTFVPSAEVLHVA